MLQKLRIKGFFKGVLLSVVLTGVNVSYADVSCRSVLQGSLSEELVLPRNLKIDNESAQIILGGEYKEALEVTSRLFQSLENPILLSQIASSFRSHIFVSSPTNFKGIVGRVSGAIRGEGFITPFADFKVAAPDFIKNLELSEQELIDVWNIYSAIRKNIDEGFIANRNQRYLLALFLSQSESKVEFGASSFKTKISYTITEALDKVMEGVTPLLRTPFQRSMLNRLIHDEGSVRELQSLLNSSVHGEMGSSNGILSKVGKASYKLKADENSRLVVTVVLNNLLQNFLDRSRTITESMEGNIHGDRDDILNNFEEYLLDVLADKSLAANTVSIMDKLLFNTPLPIELSALNGSVTSGALRYWLPAKSEAAAIKGNNRNVEAESRLAELRSAQNTSFTIRSYEAALPVNSNTQRRNPKKRKNGRRASRNEEAVVQETKDEVLLFEEDLVPVAGVEYQFHFLRSERLGVQEITFAQEVIDEMKRHNISWRTFLAPINYGFTTSSGQNGIKTLNSNDNGLRPDLYEVRPGGSDYRMFMLKDGNSWTVIKMIHHSHVRREVRKL